MAQHELARPLPTDSTLEGVRKWVKWVHSTKDVDRLAATHNYYEPLKPVVFCERVSVHLLEDCGALWKLRFACEMDAMLSLLPPGDDGVRSSLKLLVKKAQEMRDIILRSATLLRGDPERIRSSLETMFESDISWVVPPESLPADGSVQAYAFSRYLLGKTYFSGPVMIPRFALCDEGALHQLFWALDRAENPLPALAALFAMECEWVLTVREASAPK